MSVNLEKNKVKKTSTPKFFNFSKARVKKPEENMYVIDVL